MKVTLASMQQFTQYYPKPLYQSLGVLTVAAALKKRKIHCEVIDLVEFNNLAGTNSDDIFLSIANSILETKPNVIGLSTLSDNTIAAVELCKKIKEIDASIHTVIGGPGVSFCATEILTSFPFVDTIIRGEADTSFPDYIEALMENNTNPETTGAVYRKSGSIVDFGWPEPVRNLNELPIPAYEFCQSHDDDPSITDITFIGYEVGRGCPFACSFCSTSHFFGRKFRVKSIEKIIGDLKNITKTFPGKKIRFYHDLLTLNHDFIYLLCKEIKEQLPGIEWFCDARIDTIDEPLLKEMSEAGCRHIFIGIEVGTAKLQEVINKKLDFPHFEKTMRVLNDLNFYIYLSFITGIPGEDIADVEALLRIVIWAKSLFSERALTQIHPLVVEQGSTFYREWKETLIYDDYGCVYGSVMNDSAIPLSWHKPRETIKDYPEIFAKFYYYNDSPETRIHAYYCIYLDTIISILMRNSLVFAFRILGDRLPAVIAQNLTSIELPAPNSFKNTNYRPILEALRVLIHNTFDDINDAEKYDSIANYEIAIAEVSQQQVHEYNKIIKVYYDPEKLITRLHENLPANQQTEKQLLNYLIAWDEKDSSIKIQAVPPNIAALFEGGAAN